ncbi:hypothetical protein QQG74_09285 [Micromonospora sp. FIMYZ51]|uniref:hypothetical protein n=1 Tax=Micromonospora sp. FIMYZ51 TaxID=3051832 RepID=UPI00311E14F7
MNCNCGNSTNWNGMTITAAGITATCGDCGATVNATERKDKHVTEQRGQESK